MEVGAGLALGGLGLAAVCLWQAGATTKPPPPALASLRRVYLPAHLLALLADWLQGPYVYRLYQVRRHLLLQPGIGCVQHYGHSDQQIALLFLSGYLSSLLLGSSTGPAADKYGRRRMGQVFCLVCTVNCLTKLSPSFPVLLAGRILSGVSTSCLHSVFESW